MLEVHQQDGLVPEPQDAVLGSYLPLLVLTREVPFKFARFQVKINRKADYRLTYKL